MVPDWQLVYPKTAQALVKVLAGSLLAANTVVWLDDLHRLLAEPFSVKFCVLNFGLSREPAQ